MQVIDLRSDTVTKPSEKMRQVMAKAEVGDDVYGEDPTVNALEAQAAELLGTEAAIFAATGTQSNLLALLSHCERGEEYIVGQDAHTYKYEAGGAAVLGSIQPQPLNFEKDGSLDLSMVQKAIKEDDFHFARTKLLCLENTKGGKVLPLEYLAKARQLADQNQLSFHLDGARVFNAAVKLNVPVREISQYFDSTSICLSKGLGAPVGSVLCGTQELIDKSRRWRKMLGGGMRQAGILAAAGIMVLTENVERLALDHENALKLAQGLAEIEALQVTVEDVQTNMLFLTYDEKHSGQLPAFLREKGILISSDTPLRLVTHLDISSKDISTIIEGFKAYFHQID